MSYSAVEAIRTSVDGVTPLRRADPSAINEMEWARLRAIEVLQNAFILTDPRQDDNPIVYHNPEFEALTGYSADEIDGRNCRFLQGPGSTPEDVAAIREAVASDQAAKLTIVDYKKDGTRFWNALVITPIKNDAGDVTFWAGTQTDITELKNAQDALYQGQQRLSLAMESGKFGSWELDLATGTYTNISPIWKAQFGLSEDADVSRDDFIALLHPDDRAHVQAAADAALEGNHTYDMEYRCIWPDGSEHWISSHGTGMRDGAGLYVKMVGMTHDITERKEQEAQREKALADAQEQADRDPLTGLFNHRVFQKRLSEESARAQREEAVLAVAMLDLDNFKFFNDAYGHATGDDVLCLVAEKLKHVCRPYDTLARYGGDEFALLLPGVGSATAGEVEARLRSDLSGLVYHPRGEASAIPLTISIGVALFGRGAADRSELIPIADERLRRAKATGEAESEAEQLRLSIMSTSNDFSMLDALVTAVDNKDRYTRRHSEDVMEYSLMIAQQLGLEEGQCRTVAVAALLHDVGKIGVPDAILRKPGKLTDAEFEAVKKHPQMGAAMVAAMSGLEDTLEAVRHHHERWDGAGYPYGLRGEETPVIARLMAVADAFSAMTTDRPYRQGMSRSAALSVLEEGAGGQWDPECVSVFAVAMTKDLSESLVQLL